jgi:myo-inositol-1(or 4)-monophosphatase
VRAGDRGEDLERIAAALAAAGEVLAGFTAGEVAAQRKAGGSPVTEADRRVNAALAELLPRGEEGWLSEETADDRRRLGSRRVWVVDPLDGTREFVEGLPEWCVSVGLVEGGRAVAGGILSPSTGETFLGSLETGVTRNGQAVAASSHREIEGALVLASRSEVRRGEWDRFEGGGFTIRALGSVALKLALVAAGLADATWTLVPKNEWDLAAGVALVTAAGGVVRRPDGGEVGFNRPDPLYPGLVACGPGLIAAVEGVIAARGGGGGGATGTDPPAGAEAGSGGP